MMPNESKSSFGYHCLRHNQPCAENSIKPQHFLCLIIPICVHAVFLDGVVLDDGAYKSFDALEQKRLEESFREHVFEFLKEKQ